MAKTNNAGTMFARCSNNRRRDTSQLEFAAVFIVGCEDGNLPHEASMALASTCFAPVDTMTSAGCTACPVLFDQLFLVNVITAAISVSESCFHEGIAF